MSKTKLYPAISLHKTVIFPGEIATLKLEALHNRNVLKVIQGQEQNIALIFYSSANMYSSSERIKIAVEARILSQNYSGLEYEEMVVQGVKRIALDDYFSYEDRLFPIDPSFESADHVEADQSRKKHIQSMINRNVVFKDLKSIDFDFIEGHDIDKEEMTLDDHAVVTQILKLYDRLSKSHFRFTKEKYPILRNFREEGDKFIDLLELLRSA